MNMFSKINKLTCGLIVLFVSLYSISCTKEEKREFNQDRLFTPGRISIEAGEKQATMTWNPSLFSEGKDLQYTVELSKDSSFQTIEYTAVLDTALVTITDDVLKPRQKYVVRVKANAYNNIPESNWILSSRFSITGEQWFKPLASANIIDNAVLLNWTVNPSFTKITITPQGGQPRDLVLTAAELASGKKLITGLAANTTYSVELFDPQKSKGYLVFTTNPPLSGNLVDLRGIEGRPGVLADTIPVVPANSTIILKRGQTYNITSSILLDKAISIVSGDDLSVPEQAIIFSTIGSAFNIAENSNIQYLKFKNVTLKTDSYSGKYIFNVSTSFTVDTISFESCRAEILRGVFRTQTKAATVSEFIVNECVIDSVFNYGIVTVDFDGSKVDKIKIKNSTIYKAEKVITSKNNSTSVLIENCTVNEAPKAGGNYLVDYSGAAGKNTVTQGVTIKNCIFGVGKISTGLGVQGVKASSSTPVDVQGCYKTSDYTVYTGGTGLPNLTSFNGTSTDLWVDPTNGDFHFKASNFAGKTTAGDPRWR